MNKINRITNTFHNPVGVYRITNTSKYKTYIGSSIDLHKRIIAHDSDFRLGYISNREMLNDFRNGDRFEFEVIKFCNEDEERYLSGWEQHYIDMFHSIECGYNKNKAYRA